MRLIGVIKLNGRDMIRKSKGLGDSIEKLTKYTGIKPLVKKIIPNCGCDGRKEKLNDQKLLVNKLLYK